MFGLVSYILIFIGPEPRKGFPVSQANITNTQTTVKHELFEILAQQMAKFTSELECIPSGKLNRMMNITP